MLHDLVFLLATLMPGAVFASAGRTLSYTEDADGDGVNDASNPYARGCGPAYPARA